MQVTEDQDIFTHHKTKENNTTLDETRLLEMSNHRLGNTCNFGIVKFSGLKNEGNISNNISYKVHFLPGRGSCIESGPHFSPSEEKDEDSEVEWPEPLRLDEAEIRG